MMAEASFSDEVKVRVGSNDISVFQFTDSCDSIYANVPSRRSRNSIKVIHNDVESSEDEVAEIGICDNEQNKPLLYPRQNRIRVRSGTMAGGCVCRTLWQIFCYVAATGLLASFACFVVYFVRILEPKDARNRSKMISCSKISVEDVWVVGFPKLMTESAFRLLDINGDGILDVLFGFATGAEGYNVPDVVCDIYFSGTRPCLGGLMALDGKSGRELWRHYSPHEIFAVNCNEDLDGDSVKDCVIAGRVGTFEAVSSRDGHLLWNFTDHTVSVDIMNLYTGQFVQDLNQDAIPDIVNIHGGDPFAEPGSAKRLSGKLMIFSGKDGEVLQQVTVPDGGESYYSPVLYTRKDGTEVVLFGTGGETHPGSLWMITLHDLYKGNIKQARKIYSNRMKGIMTPPVLVDLTSDGVPDIVFSTYNSTVMAVDGDTFQQLWNFTYPMSETYATPSPGFYNSDEVPDFMVHWQYGPGFPVYYHSVTTVVDGLDGSALVVPYIRSSVGAQTSPLAIAVEGFGNDIFLYWNADCKNHEGEGGEFAFVKGTNVHEQSRSDFCRLRFKSEGFSRMYALSSLVKAPGVIIYDSDVRKTVEHQWMVNTTAEAIEFLQKHSEKLEDFRHWIHHLQQHSHDKPDATTHHLDKTLSDKFFRNKGNVIREDRTLWPPLRQVEDDYELNSYYDEKRNPPPQQSNIQQDVLDDWMYHSQNRRYPLHSKEPSIEKTQKIRRKNSHRSRVSFQRDDVLRKEGKLQNLKEGISKLLEQKISGNSRHTRRDRMNRNFERREAVDGRNRKKPKRRHVGPHDEGGLQRLISTGTLAPPLLDRDHADYDQSMDIIFATYWFFPAKTQTLLPRDRLCIEQRMATQDERYDPTSEYYGMDDDQYEEVVTEECLGASGHQLPENGTYQSQTMYTPYTVNMGQLTVYRLRVKCVCGKLSKGERCSRMLPFTDQQWSAYMGRNANAHWSSPSSRKLFNSSSSTSS